MEVYKVKDVLKFYIGQNLYGIAISEVNEIINYQKITPVPNTHPSVEGIFMPRKQMITAIDTLNFLQLGKMESRGMFLLATIQGHEVAFHIDSVERIERVEEDNIITTTVAMTEIDESVVSGVVKVDDNKLMVMLDFNKIVESIAG